jgi:hypothetical protein
MGSYTPILMFREVTDRLDVTNKLLAKIEKHLKSLTLPPDMVDWAKAKQKDFPKVKDSKRIARNRYKKSTLAK